MTTKTWKNKTAGGHLKQATIGQSKAGIWHVWIGTNQAMLTGNGSMVIANINGVQCDLELSTRARRTLERLEAKTESMMLTEAR